MEGRMISWVVFLGLGSCVRAGLVVLENWKPEAGLLGLPLGFRQTLPDMCLNTADEHFSYSSDDDAGPEHWREISPCCGGQQQSPIDISYSVVQAACFGPLQFSEPGTVTSKVINNGHTLKSSGFSRTLTMANVPHSPGNLYNLLQVHLHWGRKGVLASEHKLNGKGFIGEMHLVFFNSKYGTSDEAMRYGDGLAVIGIFLADGIMTTNWDLKNLLKAAASCTNPNATTAVSLNPRLLLPSDWQYVTYAGSLTTPPCSQNVRWIVMLEPLMASFIEMDILRNLMEDGEHTIASSTNERPVQPLNSRLLQFNSC